MNTIYSNVRSIVLLYKLLQRKQGIITKTNYTNQTCKAFKIQGVSIKTNNNHLGILTIIPTDIYKNEYLGLAIKDMSSGKVKANNGLYHKLLWISRVLDMYNFVELVNKKFHHFHVEIRW